MSDSWLAASAETAAATPPESTGAATGANMRRVLGAQGGLRSETFAEEAPLGMSFTESFHKETQEMYIHLGSIKSGSQGATRGLTEGMRLVQVDDWPVHRVSYDDVIAHVKRRPVTLHFTECEAGRALFSASGNSADAAGVQVGGEWQTLCAEAQQLSRSMAAAVQDSNAMLGIAAPALDGSADHRAAVDAALDKMKARMPPELVAS